MEPTTLNIENDPAAASAWARQQAAEAESRQLERIRAAYRNAFGTVDGALVLRDILAQGYFDAETGIERDNLEVSAVIEGRKELARHVLAMAGRKMTLAVT